MGLIDKQMPGEGAGPDNSAQHEGAEKPEFERAENGGATESGGFSAAQQAELDEFGNAARKALYDDGGVADKVAAAIGGSGDGVAKSMADLAYDITGMIDEKLGGKLDEELLAPAAADVLGELFDIGKAASAGVTPKVVAHACQLMLARFISEHGGSGQDVETLMRSASPDAVAGAVESNQGGGA